MRLLKYLLLACLLLSACTKNNVDENNQQATEPPVEQTELAVTTTTTTVVTTTPKVTTTVTTTTPEVKEPITEYMGFPINWFNDDAYLETGLFKPFIIDGRFQSVGNDKTLYVWKTHCTEDNFYYLPEMPGGRVGCTLLNEKATNDMIDVRPFLEPMNYGNYTYKYNYGINQSFEINSSKFNQYANALEGFVQFPDYFMYHSETYVTLDYPFSISIETKNNEKVSFMIDCVFENGFTVDVTSASEDLNIHDKSTIFAKLYVPKENAPQFVEELRLAVK